MFVTNDQIKTIEAGLSVVKGKFFTQLSKADQEKVVNADKVMIDLFQKKLKDNERKSAYIADKRKTDPKYARSTKK